MEYHDPSFFVSQSKRLSALLDTVVAETKDATDPDACIDYLELTDILVGLLDLAQFYSVLSPYSIRSREIDVRSFIGRVQTIQDAVGDWEVRTKDRTYTTSKKRARSIDIETETTEALKRPKINEVELDMSANAALNHPVEDVVPSIETEPTAWWCQPFCD